MTKEIKTNENSETSEKDTTLMNGVHPNVVTTEQMNAFMQHIIQSENFRNKAIISMMFFTGMRISEVLNLKVEDFNFENQTVNIIDKKIDKKTDKKIYIEKRITFIPQELIKILTEYIESENKKEGLLFISNKGNRLDRTVINKIFSAYSKDKLVHVTPRHLRHNWCHIAANGGLNPSEMAKYLGHISIQSTEHYFMNHTQENTNEKINDLFKPKK
ncbi:site-specific integrase [Clostridium estertheticum]|uniref:tyrosine-type recombinase/integrase n=1 Tax=Clostridium estertheticum TaxID=238834 RepID=UPI001C0B75DD|nr:site-specific integrase [Clostridium estertheticum]MBU3201570.1 site-specific integrase [Clostridium estertheticum]WAG66268.1 site-specific integrase [Clostridium estertheticum]